MRPKSREAHPDRSSRKTHHGPPLGHLAACLTEDRTRMDGPALSLIGASRRKYLEPSTPAPGRK
jgi:hypothetical protein